MKTYEADAVFQRNLKALLQHFEISNAKLAKTIGVDNSLISRWLVGSRSIRRFPEYAERIAAFFVSRLVSEQDILWLKLIITAQYPESQIGGMADLKQWMAYWLYPKCEWKASGQSAKVETPILLMDSFSRAMNAAEDAFGADASDFENEVRYDVKAGFAEITLLLRCKLATATPGSQISIYLSSENLLSAIDKGIVGVITEFSAANGHHVCMLIQSSNNSQANSKLFAAYMPLLVTAQLEFMAIQGTPQTFTTSMTILIPNQCAITIQETAMGSSPPIATVINERRHLIDLAESYERSKRYARPMMNVFNDSFARNIIEIFFEEYGVPGSLDVIKDGLNPMFMPLEQFGKIVTDMGIIGGEHAWRYNEFARFKASMDEVLRASSFREILSMSRLREIALTGTCRMPGMYFMNMGIWTIDAEDCAAILDGYISYLQNEPNFSVVILNDEALFKPNSCWHIKNNKHFMLHSWHRDDPVMIYSDQLMLIDEFQKHFDQLWMVENKSGVSDRLAVETLQFIADESRKHIRLHKNARKSTLAEQTDFSEKIINS